MIDDSAEDAWISMTKISNMLHMNGVMLEDNEFMKVGLCGNARHGGVDLHVFDEFGGMMKR